ncbi:MAG: hypothetical protein N2663_09005 [Chlorobi bacterium]|nr:hypothetical protein [Chlorobiota bacterium]
MVVAAYPQQWHEASPLDRQQWYILRYRDPQTGTIPAHAAENDAAMARRIASTVYSKQPHIASTTVEPIGPINVAGRTRAFAIDSRAPSVFMCGGVSGGVWRSIDAGRSWVRMTPPDLVPHVSSIVQSQKTPDTWYIGTGEGLSTTERRTSTLLRTIGTGTGIYRSTNNGITWHAITPPSNAQPNSIPESPWQIIWRLAVRSDSSGETLYAACYGGIYSWDGNRWRLELGDTSRPAFATDIVSAGNKLYAALGAADDGSRSQQYGIFEWSGGRWRAITPAAFSTMRRIVLATSTDGSVVYAFAQAPSSWSERYISFSSVHQLWQYSALQQRWRDCSSWLAALRSPIAPFGTLGGYCMAIAVHPRNPDIVYIGGTDVFSSHDGCRTSAYHLGGYPYTVEPSALHPDIHALVFDRVDPNRVYAATDGGVYATSSALAQDSPEWESLNTGLMTTQAYHVAIDRRSLDQFVIAGFQDNSNWYTNAAALGIPWVFAGGGDGCRVLVGQGRGLVFASSQFGYIYALDARPETPRYIQLPQPPRSGSAFATEFGYDPATGYLVLALDSQLYRLYVTPTVVDQRWELAASLPYGTLITTLTLRGELALVGTASGTLYIADIYRGYIEPISVPLPRGAFVSAIDWDEADISRIIVTVSNYTLPSIFATWDSGESWLSVGGTLDEEQNGWGPSLRVVRSLYRNGKRLYVAGTSIGAFVADSLSASTQWQPLGVTTLGFLPVEAIDIRSTDGMTAIGTHGGGIYVCYLDPSTVGSEQPAPPKDFFVERCVPEPVSDFAIVYVHVPRPEGILTFELYDILGRPISERSQPVVTPGVVAMMLGPADLDGIAQGTYFYRVRWKDRIASGAFVRVAR